MDAQAVRREAVEAFNQAWTLMEKPGRTAAETEAMIAAAERSHMLWLQVGEPVNDQRGHWMIARTAVEAGRAEIALAHARFTLDRTRAAREGDGGFRDFDFASPRRSPHGPSH